jgi:hypothetical protein
MLVRSAPRMEEQLRDDHILWCRHRRV